MKFNTNIQVIGVRKFNDTIDGKPFDFCKVRALVPVDEANGNEKGFNVVEYPYGEASNIALFAGLTFPFPATAELEIAMKGKNQIVNLISFKPVAKTA